MNKNLILGIDTGGTHTDAVVYDPITRAVNVSAKAPTTHQNLSIGISEALEKLAAKNWAGGLQAIERIHLSTTLATNSVAEGYGTPIGLIMIGYDSSHETVSSIVSQLPMAKTFFVTGGHDFYGREESPLDEEAIRQAVLESHENFTAWAVSGMFSVKNPDHEVRAAEIIRSISNLPITMGRDLTGQYDAVRRAATAALNAGLIVIINRLLDAVKQTADKAGLKAALMVVKGDGTLVSEEWARARPIETVVSGPAASILGAKVLGRGLLRESEGDLWVMDVGGTTTDLAYLKKGNPIVNESGAKIGRWNTMTLAVQTRTRGLGGDSMATINSHNGLIDIGPRRALPLCRLVEQYPKTGQDLRSQKVNGASSMSGGIFFLPGLSDEMGLNAGELSVVKAMKTESPLPLTRYMQQLHKNKEGFVGLKSLQHPAIAISAFTPTDAMAVLGLYNEGSREAAIIGADILGRPLRLSPEQVAEKVLDEFGRLLAEEVISYRWDQESVKYDSQVFAHDGLLGAALNRRETEGVEIVLRSQAPLFLLGGPAGALSPFLSRYLEGHIIVPPVFDTASAIGAAAAPLSLSRRVEIHLLPGRQGYRLFLPDEVIEGWSVEILMEKAKARMEDYMKSLAVMAGATKPMVEMAADERKILLKNGRTLHLGASLTFTAKQTN